MASVRLRASHLHRGAVLPLVVKGGVLRCRDVLRPHRLVRDDALGVLGVGGVGELLVLVAALAAGFVCRLRVAGPAVSAMGELLSCRVPCLRLTAARRALNMGAGD